jgi:predicted nucleotide-binding protein
VALFHVRITIAGKSRDETKLDLTEDQLEQQFLAPYREGRPITVNGCVIELANLERIRISTSEHSARDFIPQLRAEAQSSSVIAVGGPTYEWKAAARAQDVTDELISGPPGQFVATPPAPNAADPKLRRVSVPSGPADGRSVFLVHGRNRRMRDAIAQFLRSLDLKVIEWEQAAALTAEPNPYIGDILAQGLEAADGIVVLATPDDIVRLDPSLAEVGDPELTDAAQPRQNVIYEAGMAMALAPTRTLLVATPGTKILSDLAGRHLVYLSNASQARKRLIGRLQTIGLRVDDSGEDWLTAGDFGD